MNTMRALKLGLAFATMGAALLLTLGSCSSRQNVVDPNGNGPGGSSCETAPTAEGCACDTPGQKTECGEVIRRSNDFVTCSIGQRTCTAGKWGVCEGDKIALHSVAPIGMGGIELQNVPCAGDPCNPNCYEADVDGGIDASGIQATEGGGLTLVSNAQNCTGLACQIVQCDGAVTTITGTVTDPRGVNPIYNAFVYIPNAPLQPFPAGVQADQCGGGGSLSGNPIVATQTAANGTFTLTNVPAGANIPLVIQIGHWRRLVTIPNVPQCTTTNANNAIGCVNGGGSCANPVTGSCVHALCSSGTKLTKTCDGAQNCVTKVCNADPYCCGAWGGWWDSQCVNEVAQFCGPLQCAACGPPPPPNGCALHLPQDKIQGDLPQMALVSGGCDAFECLMKRIGVATTEFTPYTGTGRIHHYRGVGGAPLLGGSPFMDYLFQSQAQVDKYDIVLLPCDCGNEYFTSSYTQTFSVPYTKAQDEMVAYANKGGRFFTSHWGRNWIERKGTNNLSPFPNVAVWGYYNANIYGGVDPVNGYVDTTSAKGIAFNTWLGVVGVTNPFSISPSRFDARSVIAPTERWVYAWSDNNPAIHGNTNPDNVPNMAFATPLSVPQNQKVGRVVFSDTHVSSQDNGSPWQFPSMCSASNTMTSQEKALEFIFFDLSSCNNPIVVAPYPNPQTFQVDYNASCTNQQKVVWRFFDWKVIAPSDSNIVFQAQTADAQNLLGAAPQVALGTASVALLTAVASPPPPANWIGADVGVKLATIPSISKTWLRVSITLNPSSNKQFAPTLSAWRQLYDCVDNL